MITGYCQNNRIDEARSLFDSFAGKNVRTWTTLLTGYAKHGDMREAERLFEVMPERNVVSYNAMISGYVQNGDLRRANMLFDEMPERNVASWNSILTGYCHCCLLSEAREIFDLMPEKNSVSYMVMISGYVHSNNYREAWDIFLEISRSQVKPDQSILVVVLSAIIGLNNLELINNLRTIAIKTGYEGDVVVGTAILNAYTRNGSVNSAIKFFKTMPEKNEYSLTTMIAAFSQCGRLDDAIDLYDKNSQLRGASKTVMISAFAQNGRIKEARLIFDEIINPNVITWNAMVAGYSQNGLLKEAKEMFIKMPIRNSASWAAMIAGSVHNGEYEEALKLLIELNRLGNFPSDSTLTSSLLACTSLGDIKMGKQIHSLTIKTGSQYNSFVGNGLISMYAKCKNMEDVSQVFSKMREKDTVSYNSFINGLSENLMLDDARNTFEKMPQKDVVSWTSMISAYVQAGYGDIALELFIDMLSVGNKPNQLTVTTLLSACGSLGATKLGEQIHGLIFKLGLDSYLYVGNSLITMYFKCGCENGFMVFEEMDEHDIITFNAVLAGCGQNGLGNEAIQIFKQMEEKSFLPNEITFLGVLCACSHAGLVNEGWEYFNSMSQDYKIMPLVYHYTCMVDLLGRAERLNEAEALIESMPVKSDTVIWEALLAACKIHRNIEIGQRVAERLFEMEAHRPGTYVLLSNIYAEKGMWNKVGEIRKLMKDRGIVKEPGFSWIQIKEKIHCFHTGDKTHEQIKEIHLQLNEFYERFRLEGYVPNTSFVLHDVEEEQKQNELLYHSEKLAAVFGILTLPNGVPVQIMKNLRICGDCHTFMKFMSKVTARKIIIRDGNRFHHFSYGLCSCRDYW